MTNVNQEFTTVTVVESKDPSADMSVIGSNTLLGGMFGMNPNIAEARGVFIAQDVNGNHSAAVVDYVAGREVPLVVTERTIQDVVYERLSASFDKINGAIEG